jgi:hypothetical protein
MPTYTIQHRINTLLELWDPFEFSGFRLSPFDFDSASGRHGGWLAEKSIEARSVEDAFKEFSDQLYNLADRVAFIGQCHTTVDLETFAILKPGDDRFFYRYSEERGSVALHFNEEEVASLEMLERYEETGDVFRYLGEATNATSFYTRLVMLVSALEAMAGELRENGFRDVNRRYIANEILRDEALCERLFGRGQGIRNQILHGGFVDPDMHGAVNYNETIYEAIIDYFNERHGTKIDKTAVGRPRTISGNYNTWNGWCQWVSPEHEFSLVLMREKFDSSDAGDYYALAEVHDDF